MATPAKDKIIVALDTSSPQKAMELVLQIKRHVGAFKIGKEFMQAMLRSILDPNQEQALKNLQAIRTLFAELNGQIFWDGKFNDIPNTVSKATGESTRIGIKMLNVHCLGGRKMMTDTKLEAIKAPGIKTPPLVLGVTVLTSLTYEDFVEMGLCKKLNIADPEDLALVKRDKMDWIVRHLALLARDSGLDGVIASAQEARVIRRYCGKEFLIVTPAIRPEWAPTNDQKRPTTPSEAILAGADYLVIGRPITDPPKEIGTPLDAARAILSEIEFTLGTSHGSETRIKVL